jgi:hypothetical protein
VQVLGHQLAPRLVLQRPVGRRHQLELVHDLFFYIFILVII